MPFADPDYYEDLYEFPKYEGKDYYFVRIWQNTNELKFNTATFRWKKGDLQRYDVNIRRWMTTDVYDTSDQSNSAGHLVYIRIARPDQT